MTLQSHVETAQCRHKPISKFTCNSYEGYLSCLTNSGLLRSRPSDAIKKRYLRHFPASISLKIKGSKLSETLHTCRVLRWSCCSQSVIKACEARTKDFHRPFKFCLSLSPSLLLLVLVNVLFFTFFLGPFDWIPFVWIWFESHLCPAQFSFQSYIILPLIYVSEWVTLFKLLSW